MNQDHHGIAHKRIASLSSITTTLIYDKTEKQRSPGKLAVTGMKSLSHLAFLTHLRVSREGRHLADWHGR